MRTCVPAANRWRAEVALGLIWLLHATINFSWLRYDTRPPTFDAARHAVWALHVARQPFVTQPLAALAGLFSPHPYPPLTYWVSAPFVFLFGQRADVLVATQLVFLALLFWATYQAGREIRGERVGLLAVALLSLYPMVYGLSRFYLLDLPQMALAALTLWLLLRVRRFDALGPSLWLGAALAAGMLTKWTFAAVVAAPLLFVVARAVWPQRAVSRSRLQRRWLHVVAALLVGLVLALPWYVVHLADLARFFGSWTSGSLAKAVAVGGDHSVSSLLSSELSPVEALRKWLRKLPWLYYARGLVMQQMTLPLALLLLLALIRLRSTLWRWPDGLLLFFVASPYFTFSFFSITDIRYTASLLPAVALISALGWFQIRPGRVWAGARWLMGLCIVLAALLFASVSTNVLHWLPATAQMRLMAFSHLIYTEALPTSESPLKENWQVDALTGEIVNLLVAQPPVTLMEQAEDGAVQVLILPLVAHYEDASFWYTINEQKLPIEVLLVLHGTPQSDAEQVARSEFIITKTGDLGRERSITGGQALTAALHDAESELHAQFALAAALPLPDGSTGELYARSEILNNWEAHAR